ncbi:4-coumarate-CoA ligase [Halenospora varia]|nr:4-coumarate-CoA ligase [Halenospora varia]
MPFKSLFPDVIIPDIDLLSYLFPSDAQVSSEPIWIDSSDPSKSLSPKELLLWTKRFANSLQGLGLVVGDVCMIFTPNHIFVPVAFVGCVAGGFIFSGSNPLYNADEMAYQLQNTGAKVMLVHPSLLRTAIAAALKVGFPQEMIFQLSGDYNPPIWGIKDWRSLIREGSDLWRWQQLTGQEAMSRIATINYSSGTTGLPKGVCISHRNLIANVEQHIIMRGNCLPHSPGTSMPMERWVGFLPLYHAFGQMYTVLLACKLSVPIYIMTNFQYESFLRIIETYKITHLQIVPPIMTMLSQRPETSQYDLSSLKDIICGAAPLSRSLQNEISFKFGVSIKQGWGMTEVTCGAMHVPDGVSDNTGSVGMLDPCCECKLIDDSGAEVGCNTPGEIYIRGPNVCVGFWRNENETRSTIDNDGWLKTGDIAMVNEKGWFHIVDRKKELIKVNGFQVAPAELEAVLMEHEDIADAAVVGVLSSDVEKPVAYVMLKLAPKLQQTEMSISSWMASRVAKHKRLTGGVFFVDQIPRAASGKILRKTVKEWAKRDTLAKAHKDLRSHL